MSDFYSTGTVSVTGGTTAVTGVGTMWVAVGVMAGDTIELAGQRATIASVDSNTTLTLAAPWAGADQSGATYTIRMDAPTRFTSGYLATQVRALIDKSLVLEKARPNYEVQSLGANAPPGAPVTGDLYVVGPAPTGAWAGQANNLAQWTGSAWLITAPQRGTTVVSATGKTYIWAGGAWGVYVPPSPFIEGLMDDADAAAARATLGAQEAMTVSAFSKTYLDDTSGDAVCTTIGAARLNQFTSGTPTSSIAWYKFPDGTIEQRGSSVVTTDSSGIAPITFPTGFSGARSYTMVVTNGDFDSLPYSCGIMTNNDWPQATASLVFVRDLSTGAPAASTTLRVDWLAVGR